MAVLIARGVPETVPEDPSSRSIAWALLQSVLVAALLTAPLPETDAPAGSDKIVHGLLFLWLGACWAWTGPGRRMPMAVVFFVAGFGAAMEAVQAVLPWRSAEAWDLLADTLGALAGVGLVGIGLRLLDARSR